MTDWQKEHPLPMTYFVHRKSTGQIRQFDTPEKVALYMLGRLLSDYECFVAQPFNWPSPEHGEIAKALSEFRVNVQE
jgi:hypothetical protein